MFASAVRRYENATDDRVLSVDAVQLNQDDSPRKLFFAEQIRRVKAFKDASEGKGPFPLKGNV